MQVFYKLLHQIQPYLSKFNCFINGFSTKKKSFIMDFLACKFSTNCYIKYRLRTWFTPNSSLSSHISFLVSQTQFLCLSHISISTFSLTLSNFCLVPNLGCMFQFLTQNFDKVLEPTHCISKW